LVILQLLNSTALLVLGELALRVLLLRVGDALANAVFVNLEV
jgi:hypothetical protein